MTESILVGKARHRGGTSAQCTTPVTVLVQETASTLALLGVSGVADLRRDHVRLRPA